MDDANSTEKPAESPSLYLRARELHGEGMTSTEIARKLAEEGADPESATIAAGAVAGRVPVHVDQMGDATLETDPGGLVISWTRGTVADAQVHLILGALVVLAGVVGVFLWAFGKPSVFPAFSPLLIAMVLFRYNDLAKSILRVLVVIALILFVLRNTAMRALVELLAGDELTFDVAVLSGAAMTVLFGGYYAVRGAVMMRLHYRDHLDATKARKT